MFYTDDPVADYERYDAEQSRRLERRPICCCCEEHIQEEKAFYYDSEWFCPDCEKELMEVVWEDIRNDYLCDVDE